MLSAMLFEKIIRKGVCEDVYGTNSLKCKPIDYVDKIRSKIERDSVDKKAVKNPFVFSPVVGCRVSEGNFHFGIRVPESVSVEMKDLTDKSEFSIFKLTKIGDEGNNEIAHKRIKSFSLADDKDAFDAILAIEEGDSHYDVLCPEQNKLLPVELSYSQSDSDKNSLFTTPLKPDRCSIRTQC